MNRNRLIIFTLAVGLIAGGLRFFRLGDWPFAGDELATFSEADALLKRHNNSLASQDDRLPRMIPLSHLTHSVGYYVFGRGEYGSRVLLALFGTATVVIVFLSLGKLISWPTALIVSGLMALWPEHLFQSQQNRFYIVAAFFSTLCMLSGAQAIVRRGVGWPFISCLFGFAGLLSHSLQIVLLPGLFMGWLVGAWIGRRPLPWRSLGMVSFAGLLAGVFVLLYLAPLAQGWNSGSSWGYSSGRALLASLLQIGWPVVLLGMVGAASFWKERSAQGIYWLVWAGVWLLASAVFPQFVAYHPSYVFPLALAPFVLAGRGAAHIYELLRPASTLTATAWIAAVLCFSLPNVASFYRDGSRYDFRTAARYIDKHLQPGDRIAAISSGTLKYYMSCSEPIIGLPDSNPLSSLKELSKSPGRLWIVLQCGRAGYASDLDHWLGLHCFHELKVRAVRFDYYDFTVNVFLCAPACDDQTTE